MDKFRQFFWMDFDGLPSQLGAMDKSIILFYFKAFCKIIVLMKYFFSELLCELCIQEAEDKVEMARRHNCSVLKRRLDFNRLDDSFEDPDYCVPKNKDTSSDSEEDADVYDFDNDDLFNPFEENASNDSHFNPFGPNHSNVPNEEPIKQAEGFNPFASSSPIIDSKHEKVLKKDNTCPHCETKYSSSYNLKQHQISVHKIFPPGMKLFKCTADKCGFVTGNRVQFSRHNHSKQTPSSSTKTFCQVCKEQFYNPSSLKRHVGRVHK